MLFRKKCMQIYNPRISMHQFIVITAHLLCRNASTAIFWFVINLLYSNFLLLLHVGIYWFSAPNRRPMQAAAKKLRLTR